MFINHSAVTHSLLFTAESSERETVWVITPISVLVTLCRGLSLNISLRIECCRILLDSHILSSENSAVIKELWTLSGSSENLFDEKLQSCWF